jgi:hypothetical protein
VVLAMMGARQMMNVTIVTAKIPAPTQLMINGAIATMGTVCSRIV